MAQDDVLNISDLQSRLADLKRKRDAAARRVDQYTADIKAIERTLAILGKSLGDIATPPGIVRLRAARGQLSSVIRELIQTIDGDFGTADIAKMMLEKNPETVPDKGSIANVVRRLVDEGILEQTVDPSGRRPGRYTRFYTPNRSTDDTQSIE